METQRHLAVMIAMIIITAPARAAEPSVTNLVSDKTAELCCMAGHGIPSTGQVHSNDAFSCCPPSVSALPEQPAGHADRLWLISTRHLTDDLRLINLQSPNFRVARLDAWGNERSDSLASFFSQLTAGRPLVIHVHGNRMTQREARDRGRFVHHNVKANLGAQPIDFVIFSWPSERTGMLLRDGRIKAQRTDAVGLYLAWLLREAVIRDVPVVLIGYSFGGRVATGSLHALAGGALGGRQLPGVPIRGANIGVGLVAPAIEEDWLERGRYHGLASQNIREMALFYNPRDAVLRRFWLIDLATRGRALGYSGPPRRLAPGFDGQPVPMTSRNCTRFLGIRHSEYEYYSQGCRAGRAMAELVRRHPAVVPTAYDR